MATLKCLPDIPTSSFVVFPDAQVPNCIAGVRDDGSAIYKPLAAANYATLSPDHVFHLEGAKDCDGKSLDQLKKDGRTRDLRP
jgi:hypothetical protein